MSQRDRLRVPQVRTVMRTTLLRVYGNRCHWCGQSMAPEDITFEHLKPRSEGGRPVISNLRLVHRECNR